METENGLTRLLKLYQEEKDTNWLFDEFLFGIRKQAESRLIRGNKQKAALEEICQSIDSVSQCYKNGTKDKALLYGLFKIGALYGRFVEGWESEFTIQESLDHLDAFVSELKRNAPLERKRDAQQAWASLAKDYAATFWSQEDHKDLRIGDMCDVVWAALVEEIKRAKEICGHNSEDLELILDVEKALPDKAGGLRTHIKEVAPQSARKPGAPKK